MATQKEIAEHLDMSERNLRDVLNKLNMPSSKHTLDEIRVAYIRDMREKAAGRGGDDQENLTNARARQAHSDARLKDLTYYEKVGALVPAELIEPLLNAWAVNGRSEIEFAIEKVIAGIESKYNIDVERELVNNEFANVFRTIGGYPRNFDKTADQGGREMGTTGKT